VINKFSKKTFIVDPQSIQDDIAKFDSSFKTDDSDLSAKDKD
jgi:hypothetical protein